MTETGLGFIQPLFFIGVVENREDPRLEGRVQVRAFGIHGSNRDIPTDDLPWATLIIGNHDVNFTPPPLNAWVFGFFIDGRDAQQPMILGLIPSQISELVNPEERGWGSIPAENYDRQAQGSRPRDLGLSPMSKLATGEFLNETYNEALETNRARQIPIAGGCARGYTGIGNGNLWSTDVGEGFDGEQRSLSRELPPLSGNEDLNESRRLAENYIGRSISDSEWDLLVRATFSEATANPAEQAAVMSVILNRVISPSYPNTITSVLNQRNQFQAVTGTSINPGPSTAFKANRSQSQLNNFANGINTYLPIYANRGWLNFTSNITAAYGQGTNIGFRDTVRNALNSEIIGGTVFGTVSGISPTGPVLPLLEVGPQLPIDPRLNIPVGSLPEDPELRTQRISEAEEIRTQIRLIDQELARPGLSGLERAELEAEKSDLESRLIRLDPSLATQPFGGDPYSGYAYPSGAPGCVSSWDEPESAYSAKYPYNRVIETASGHSIELDDTPGGERIMIWHHNGSYIQISPSSTTHKNMNDVYNVHERNHHVYIRGSNIITIDGDSYVLVKGDKVEEIQGNYKQIVHGNVSVGSAGRIEMNGAVRTDIRSASLGLDSNVENLNIRTGRNIVFQSGESINLLSKDIRMGATGTMNISGDTGLFIEASGGDIHTKASGNMFINPSENLFLKAESGSVGIASKGTLSLNTEASMALKSDTYVSIKSGENVFVESAALNMNATSGDMALNSGAGMFIKGANLNMTSEGNLNASGSSVNLQGSSIIADSAGDLELKAQGVKMGGGSGVDIQAGSINIDGDIVNLAPGGTSGPSGIGEGIIEERSESLPAPSIDVAEAIPSAQGAKAPTPATSESADGIPVPPSPSIPSRTTRGR